MRNMTRLMVVLALLVSGAAGAAGEKGDVFKGKLFPPNVILEHQAELQLTKEQFTAIKQAVVQVQADVAEHEWDVREAYQSIMQQLDNDPIDTDATLVQVQKALLAENEVKKLQMSMLIKLRNLLTEEQVAYLKSQRQ